MEKFTGHSSLSSLASLADQLAAHRRGLCGFGIYAVCSTHPQVLTAALRFAARHDTPLLVESSSNQVNHQGGYTGMRPNDFASRVKQLSQTSGNPRVVLGGDHLGPHPWSSLPATEAMRHAEEMVIAYVSAGYQKIHIDTTVPCVDDERPLSLEHIVNRAEVLCRAAEHTAATIGSRPHYVLGSEVPTPNGGDEDAQMVVTPTEELQRTVQAFHQQLGYLWPRVLGFVVQPGVEFSPHHIHHYQRQQAAQLSFALTTLPGLWVFEAHSTDYQQETALRSMVEDHFAILKVGPALTFAYREALFALAYIEEELYRAGRVSQRSQFIKQLSDTLLSHDQHWRDHYHGDKEELRFTLRFALSDRVRHYWEHPTVDALVGQLLHNLRGIDIPPGLLSQFFPGQRAADPETLIQQRITQVVARYHRACRGTVAPSPPE